MNMRLIWAAGLLVTLSGCATYDYADNGGGYYRGAPSVEYRYPAGYSDGYYAPYSAAPYGYGAGDYGYGYGDYGYGYGDYGYYGYGGPYYYRDYYGPPRHRPPPPRPDANGRPPPPAIGGRDRVKSPWRDMDRLRRPDAANAGPRPQSMQSRPAAPRPGNLGRSYGTKRTLEP
ncbi:hypothetical protein FZ025_11140 [Xanthomonas hyacinthi]|uniref:Lipoprotein n=1 Tax=Xanthomonas hyacinthi TaxID=56455 RepID=A0A2S7EX25_9XANT|nr:hypothetical protein [Xanthomonas hyacinthi]KLD79691.1 lipoprotein [Xanthomonas hyacinthi DSM 19077]PPU97647.1 hypothetical protein XhyaCFBP1156_09820 [Xanthomonas hyacinthi]QGY77168.1 hypothetical protein FZ025_11140 [Xanthomonas hyacinthi]